MRVSHRESAPDPQVAAPLLLLFNSSFPPYPPRRDISPIARPREALLDSNDPDGLGAVDYYVNFAKLKVPFASNPVYIKVYLHIERIYDISW